VRIKIVTIINKFICKKFGHKYNRWVFPSGVSLMRDHNDFICVRCDKKYFDEEYYQKVWGCSSKEWWTEEQKQFYYDNYCQG